MGSASNAGSDQAPDSPVVGRLSRHLVLTAALTRGLYGMGSDLYSMG